MSLRLVGEADEAVGMVHQPMIAKGAGDVETLAITLGQMIRFHGDDPEVKPVLDLLRSARFALVSAHLSLDTASRQMKETT